MTGETWGAVALVVGSILALAGAIYKARPAPEALSAVVKAQAEEITRLQSRITALEQRVDHVPTLEGQRAQAVAGAVMLINQVKALGHVPVWDLPPALAAFK